MRYIQFSGCDPNYLRKLNSIHRFHVRQIEKNRFPAKCPCVVCGEHFLCGGIEQYIQRVCTGCDLKNKVSLSAGTLYHLISAIPQADRDRLEIYPADYRTALVLLPLQSNWDWRWFEQRKREGELLCGITAKTATGKNTVGLRDYSEGTRLLTKFGKYQFEYRQKAASYVSHILEMPGPTEWSHGCDIRLSLYALDQLKTPDEQRTLKRIGRLYKNSCWWSKKGGRRLFDDCASSSWASSRLYEPGQFSIELEPPDALRLARKEKQEMFRIARLGGLVQHLYPPAKRYPALARTRANHNAQHGSYWNSSSINHRGRVDRWDDDRWRGQFRVSINQQRELRSLNIPRETIELRNNMIANLARDFGPSDETKAA